MEFSKINTMKQIILIVTFNFIVCLLLAQSPQEQFVKASEYLLKAQDIVSELRYSINTEIDSEIPQQLIQLYDFMYSQLVIGNIDQDIKVLQEVQKLLTELLETWKEISVAG